MLPTVNEEVIKRSADYLREHLRLPNAPMHGDPIDMKELAELVLSASFLNEEDRPTRFSLVLFDGPRRQKLRPNWPSLAQVLQLGEPLPLTLANLAKLAPATKPGESYICVTENPGVRHIWGVAHRLPFGAFVKIDVVSPGVARIRLGSFTLSYFRPGADVFVGDKHILQVAITLGRQLKTEADGHFLTAIVREMLLLAHGGTLLVVPADEDESKALESVKYRCKQPFTTLRDLLDSLYENRKERPVPVGPKKKPTRYVHKFLPPRASNCSSTSAPPSRG
jgi:hypothetical protein